MDTDVSAGTITLRVALTESGLIKRAVLDSSVRVRSA
jgi:hypothetical protein